MKLEKHYGIRFRDDDLKAYTDKTFGTFCDFVCSYINIPQKQQVSLLKKIKPYLSELRSKPSPPKKLIIIPMITQQHPAQQFLYIVH